MKRNLITFVAYSPDENGRRFLCVSLSILFAHGHSALSEQCWKLSELSR